MKLKNIHNGLFNTLLISFVAILMFSCKEEIDNYYYQDTEESVDTDILSLLKSHEEYSEFVKLLDQYQLDTLLAQGRIFTFFVPNNEAMQNRPENILGDKELIEYLLTESYVNLHQLKGLNKIQTQGGKFAVIEGSGELGYTFDGINITNESPLTNNGRFYEISNVVNPKPSLYQYIAATNPFYRNYLDSRDSVYLDKELSTPIGYTEEGLTVYDTVLSVVNLFEEKYFPVREEFRDYKATMLLFTQEQYDEALSNIADELNISVSVIADVWQNEVLMPYIIEQSVFRNNIAYSTFLKGRAKNIVGDSVDIDPTNIDVDYFECSNGRAYNLIDFQVPDILYKISDTVAMNSLLSYKGSNLWEWKVGVQSGQNFEPQRPTNNFATFGSTLLVDMGKDFNGEFAITYNHLKVFPATYKLTVRANVSKTGVYNIFVNGKQFPVDIGDGRGPQFDFDFFKLREGVVSPITNKYYPFENNFCQFDVLIDNISEFGDVEVKLVYVKPSQRNRNNCGMNLDFISLEYFDGNN